MTRLVSTGKILYSLRGNRSDAVIAGVAVAAEKVTISGHDNAKAGDTIRLSCVSAISNPPSVITWFTRGRHLPGSTSNVMPSAQVATLARVP